MYHAPYFQPAERVVLDRAARNSAQAQQAVGVSPSASRIPMAVPVDLAGGEASARKVWTKPPTVGISDPDLKTKTLQSLDHHHRYSSLLGRLVPHLCSAGNDLPSVTILLLFLACAPGHFGADCRLQCQCQNGGTCDRFSGCVCPSGWHGVHCEKSGICR